MSVRRGQIIELPPEGMFKVGNLLGSGGFGKVFVVNKMGRKGWGEFVTPEAFALKVIECSGEGAVAMAVKEAQTLMKIKHENIVQLILTLKVVERHDTFVYLLTEYCSGGNLDDRLRHNPDPSTKLNWLYQLASAITHLHSRRPMIVHRDLKPANVLLTANDVIKVADFGLARQYEALKQLGSSSASIESYYMNSGVGTPVYLAPEILTKHYTEKADVFSLGVIFYAILERSYLELSHGSRSYGAFVNPNGRTPLGIAMYYSGNSKPQEELDFPSTYKEHDKIGAKLLEGVVRKCFLYKSGMRPKATEIRRSLLEYIQSLEHSELSHSDMSDPEYEPDNYSGSEDKPDNYSGSEDEPENYFGSDDKPDNYFGTADKPDNYSDSEDEPDNYFGSEGKSDNYFGSEDKPDNYSGSDDEPDNYSGSENEFDNCSRSDDEPDTYSEFEDKPENCSGSDDEPDNCSGSDDEPDNSSGSDDADEPDYCFGFKDEPDNGSRSDDEPDNYSGSDNEPDNCFRSEDASDYNFEHEYYESDSDSELDY